MAHAERPVGRGGGVVVVGQSAARNGAGGRQEQHRIVVGGGRGVRPAAGQPQGAAEGVLPQAGGVHVHAGGRRRPGGRLRGGRRVLFHTDREPGGRRADEGRPGPDAELRHGAVERHRRVQHPREMGHGQVGGAHQQHRAVVRAGPGPRRQEGLQRPVERGHVVVLRRAHVLPVHIHHERLR